MKNIFWKIAGYDLNNAKDVLQNIENTSKDLFWKNQEEKRNNIYNFHFNNTSWYRGYCGKIKKNNWEEIPVIRKEDFQSHYLDSIKFYNKYKYYSANTSGSSGEPFSFIKDKYCHSLAWAKNQIYYSQIGLDINDRQARFFGHVRGSIKTKFFEYGKNILLNRYTMNVFDNSDDNFINIINIFKKEKFNYIYGYTNVILEFSKYINKNNFGSLVDLCPTLKCCIVTAEMLSGEDRQIIKIAAGVPIYNEYGTSETSIIAMEDVNYNWNIATDRMWIEVLDEKNIPVPMGSSGKIVITDLYNKMFPFIRYEIGDVGAIDSHDQFPYLRLKRLSGRISDIIYLPSGKKCPGLSFYYVSRSIFEKSTNIKKFKIIQKEIDVFLFLIVSKVEINDNQKKAIIQETERYLEKGLKIIFKRVDTIQSQYAGKNQHFFSEIYKNTH